MGGLVNPVDHDQGSGAAAVLSWSPPGAGGERGQRSRSGRLGLARSPTQLPFATLRGICPQDEPPGARSKRAPMDQQHDEARGAERRPHRASSRTSRARWCGSTRSSSAAARPRRAPTGRVPDVLITVLEDTLTPAERNLDAARRAPAGARHADVLPVRHGGRVLRARRAPHRPPGAVVPERDRHAGRPGSRWRRSCCIRRATTARPGSTSATTEQRVRRRRARRRCARRRPPSPRTCPDRRGGRARRRAPRRPRSRSRSSRSG